MYCLKPNIRLRRGPAETFWVFDLESGEHFEVNETAFQVVEGLQSSIEPRVVAARIASECGVTEAEVMGDIEKLLVTCIKDGLVTEEA